MTEMDIYIYESLEKYDTKSHIYNNVFHVSCHIYDIHHWDNRDKTQARKVFYFQTNEKPTIQQIRNFLIGK
jgi:hypothetical protein